MMPAFQSSAAVRLPLPAQRLDRLDRRVGVCACAPPPRPLLPAPSASAPIPGSMADAAAQAVEATRAALAAGVTRAFITIDTTAGDETYTLLKTSVPIVRRLLPILIGEENDEEGGERLCQSVEVLLPDAGAAALARRDWGEDGGSVPTGVVLTGMDRWVKGQEVDGVFIVAPRASEVEDLEGGVAQAGDMPTIVVNPDLVDMGVTGLSLNARTLRERVIDAFETTYYLRVYGWGVLLRAYPGEWGVWIDDEAEASGFRCLRTFATRPGNDEIEELLDNDADGGAPKAGGDWIRKLSRFVKVYMKG